MNVREKSTKILLGFLIVGLIAPTTFFVRPEKAEALVSLAQCIAAKVTAATTSLAKTTPLLLTSVMTISPAEAEIAAEAPAGSDWASCFLKGLVKIIAKTLLHTFVQSIVQWINSGFEGSPSFITNPEGFLNNVVDQSIGRVIEDISPLLCSPFRLDIRFSLGLNLSLRSKEEVHCTLSDVINNVRGAYDGFVGGAVGSGNLSNWIHIAGTPQNNPYGAYLATTNKINVGITSATGQQIKLLDWGKGFKSWRSCEQYGPDIVVRGTTPGGGYGITGSRKGPCIKEGPIKTPGTIIEGQTTGALATTFHELELAQEIDEVVGALINQLLVKAITGVGGLLGASKGDSSSGFSSVDALLTDPNRAIANSNAKPPEGINCRLRYYPSTKEDPAGSGVYVPDDTKDQVWTDNLGVGKTVGVSDPSDLRPIVLAQYMKETSPNQFTATQVSKPVLPKTWGAYFADVKAGCMNSFGTLVDTTSTRNLNTFGGGSGGGTPPPPAPPPPQNKPEEGNVAIGKLAEQSSTYVSGGVYYRAKNAVNGDDSSFYSSAVTGTEDHPWWQVDLSKGDAEQIQGSGNTYSIQDIREVKISRRLDAIGQTSKLWIFISSEPFNNKTFDILKKKQGNNTAYQVPDDGKETVTVPITSGEKGPYVRIQMDAYENLTLPEVRIKGTQTKIDVSNSGASVAQPPAVFAFSTQLLNTYDQLKSPTPGSATNGEEFSGMISPPIRATFTPNKSETGITLKAQFFECVESPTPVRCAESGYKKDGEGRPVPTSFLNYFTSLNFTYTVEGRTFTKNAINLPEDGTGRTYNTTPQTENTITLDRGEGGAVVFGDDISVSQINTPVQISVTGSPTRKMPFRITIEAFAGGQSVGKVNADFATQ